jgi:hypothetical protein
MSPCRFGADAFPLRKASERRRTPHSVREEDFFKGSGLVGLISRGGNLFPGILGFRIPDQEGKAMTVPVQEFIGFWGFGDDVNVTELKF